MQTLAVLMLWEALSGLYMRSTSPEALDNTPFDLLLELLLKVTEDALPPDLLYLI